MEILNFILHKQWYKIYIWSSYPLPVLIEKSVQEIVPYTASGQVMEILNYPKSTGAKHL